jgi:hypothetical protein
VEEFSRLWWSVFTVVDTSDFDEAAFHAYISLFRNFLADIKSSDRSAISSVTSTVHQNLDKALSVFDKSSQLTKGLSMERLWRHLRPKTPTTISRLRTRLQIEELAKRFDELMWRTPSTLDALIETRQSLRKALRLTTAQDVDAKSLFEDLAVAIAEFEATIPEEVTDSLPYFQHEVEGLCKIFTLTSTWGINPSIGPLLDKLEIFATRPTVQDFEVENAELARFDNLFVNYSDPTESIIPSDLTSQLLRTL